MRGCLGKFACLLSLGLGLAAPAMAQYGETDNTAIPGRAYYVSPMFSYTYADGDRGTDDGIGGIIAIGKKVTNGMTLELTGFYSEMDPSSGIGDTVTLKGAGLGAMIFPFKSSPNFYGILALMYGAVDDHPGAVPNYRTTVFDIGAGYLLPFNRYIALRTEARYRTDQHDRGEAGANPGSGAFSDGVLNVGLVFPLGVTPVATEEKTSELVSVDSGDSDNDGVPDGTDQCPDTPAGAIVDEVGCERDGDGDGVVDRLDQCPDTPAGQAVNENGCPVDADGDGVTDDIDECPNTPAGAKVLQNGCALIDDCRIPRAGEQIDENGCAVEQTFVLKGVKFEFDSDRLTPDAREILNEVANTLQAYPQIATDIEGHTDTIGSDAYNQGLSERRANAVKQYLVGRGVDGGRMTPVGYGEARPIADNMTEEGREENRRVELRVIE
ncbi:MAG: OmpA family protein [Nevskiales bacterium]|nr:OmpA family protein [Nevskiales bacterium]